ncbi:MAG: hypothetical protein HW384_827 [Dehalococcoidia bacterium]|nr:hypothetical protein [Dehalococcoidia bacterium]
MSKRPNDPLWPFRRIERDWDKGWETVINIVWTVSTIILPLLWIYANGHPGTASGILGFLIAFFFYMSVICVILQVRNSGKSNRESFKELNGKLDNLTTSINELVKRLDERWPK